MGAGWGRHWSAGRLNQSFFWRCSRRGESGVRRVCRQRVTWWSSLSYGDTAYSAYKSVDMHFHSLVLSFPVTRPLISCILSILITFTLFIYMFILIPSTISMHSYYD
jgi:hypothetical protein